MERHLLLKPSPGLLLMLDIPPPGGRTGNSGLSGLSSLTHSMANGPIFSREQAPDMRRQRILEVCRRAWGKGMELEKGTLLVKDRIQKRVTSGGGRP